MKTIEEKLQIAITALKECEHPSGAFDFDKLIHAETCIKNVIETAKQALKEIEEP